ncbi:MAG: N-acetylmuramic acid 6-phosphate etherase [Gemmatimonadetes bacterium]|nr:N-acetylmuramic acid 6-phosphate etherase [Gemmatimonadota bacterium]
MILNTEAAAILDPRITERRNPRTQQIDLAEPIGIVDLMIAEDRTISDAVATQREHIAAAITAAEETFRSGGRLFYVGAGTSGRLGVLDASECPPTFGTPPEMVQGIIAGGLAALTQAQEGAEDNLDQAEIDLKARGVRGNDMIVGIAASGTTPYVRCALEYGRALGARTVIVACSPPPARTLEVVDIPIVAITGPEVVTGSTRLKAGTATKLILNMITTGAMIRMGKTFGNLMIDLRATNVKLVDRSERIVAEVCAISREDAHEMLARADGSVKLAIVMHSLGVDKDEAARRLDAEGGAVRRVIGGEPPPVL